MCCSSSQAASAWIAAILVNLGFLSLISWGAATLWPLGCLLSALYTVFLLGLAQWLERFENSDIRLPTRSDGDDNDEEQEQQQHPALDLTAGSSSRGAENEPRKAPVLVSVLYGLAVLSFGVTGFFLPVNLVKSCSDAWQPKFVWKTNVAELPRELRPWAAQDSYDMSGASFGYVASTGVTLFGGLDRDGDSPEECVWTTTATGAEPPIQYRDYSYPDPFVVVSPDAVCFQTQQVPIPTGPFGPKTMSKGFSIYCSDGETFSLEKNSTRAPYQNALQNFRAFNGNLWFKEFITGLDMGGESGTLVYSLDPQTMLVTLYSKRVPNTDGGSGGSSTHCDPHTVLRQQALWTLVAAALPMTALSLGLWKTKQVSSMGVVTYISLSLVYVTVHLAVAPGSVDNDKPLFRWWFALSGLLWMIVSSHLLLSSSSSSEGTPSFPILLSKKSEECLRWGLRASAVGFAWGMTLLIMYDEKRDTLGWWILLNIAVFGPLIVLGAATDTTFLLVLGGLGFLADAARLAALVDATPLGVFLVFCCSGLCVGAMGYQLSRYQTTVESFCTVLVQKINQSLFVFEDEQQGQLQLFEEEEQDTIHERLVPES